MNQLSTDDRPPSALCDSDNSADERELYLWCLANGLPVEFCEE